jgi:hypothetical protein
MIDVKKLVTGFLILAVAASAAALVISGIGNASAGNTSGNTNAITATAAAQPATSLTGDAFLPQTVTQDDTDGSATSTSSTTPLDDPNNLTDVLANTYLNNLALTNPGGPTMDADGDPTLTPPDTMSVISQFVASTTVASSDIPDWDTEADQIPITVVTSSPDSLKAYGVAIGEILNANIAQTNLEAMLNNNPDPSFEPYVESKVQTSLQDISGLQTPASVVPFQKSLIKTLVYAKDFLTLAENAQTDPLKTEFIMESEDAKYDAAVQDLQTQLQNVTAQNLLSFGTVPEPGSGQTAPNSFLTGIEALVGVPVANAQGVPVIDAQSIVALWTQIANMIKAELKDIALQLIKNTLVFIMQKTIFAAIKGGGAPAFIQQWGNTLAKAFENSAISALNSQMSCVGAAPFNPQLKLMLGATYQTNQNNVCAVSFNNQLSGNTLNNFFKKFSNGGWVTFGSTLQPDNNYYGSAFFIAQAVGNTAQNAQNAAQAKAVAGQGFHGSAVCDDGSNPNGDSVECTQGDPTSAAGQIDQMFPGDSCPNGWALQATFSNNGECTDGSEPEVQTPGALFNGMANSAINGNFSLITSANDWVGLASGLFVSILQQTLNSLAQSTISDVGGLLQQASNGGGANSVSPDGLNVTANATSPQPITCTVVPDPSGNPLEVDITVQGGEVISSAGITTPSYVWMQPLGGVITPAAGASVLGTFNATGTTYQVTVNDVTDNVSQTCQVTTPSQ